MKTLEATPEARNLFRQGLEKVESQSIRDWAKRQEEIWVQIAQDILNTQAGKTMDVVERMTVTIVSQAIGL